MKKKLIISVMLLLSILLPGCSVLFPDEDPAPIATPLPRQECTSTEEAKSILPFLIKMPSLFDETDAIQTVDILGTDMLEVTYQIEGQEVKYRTAIGERDISDDKKEYDRDEIVQIGIHEVRIRGNQDTIQVANWSTYSISFSLSFYEGVDLGQLEEVVRSIA